MKDLSKIIFTEPLISRVLDNNGDVFLVGGYVRDLLRGVCSKDIDFVMRGNIRSVISRVFPAADVTVIEFKKAMTLRVVAGDYTLDFSELRGDLGADLSHRDFTMNAIAWSAGGGIADPLRGAADIREKIIRGISEKNFADDPLRLLRAYRFAGEFGWQIDKGTRKTVRKLKHLLKRSAIERITSEIIKLLNSRYCLSALKMSLKDDLLSEMFPLDREKLEENIEALSRLDSFLKKIREGSRISFDEGISQGLTYTGLLRAGQLLCGSCMDRNYLRLSKATFKRLTVVERLLKEYQENRIMDRERMFEMFTEAGDAAMDFALLTRTKRFLKEAEKFLNMRMVLSAQKIIGITGLTPGPEFGALLKEMKKMQFLGKLGDENAALKWLAGRSPQTSRRLFN